jgi:hypothetical protein
MKDEDRMNWNRGKIIKDKVEAVPTLLELHKLSKDIDMMQTVF